MARQPRGGGKARGELPQMHDGKLHVAQPAGGVEGMVQQPAHGATPRSGHCRRQHLLHGDEPAAADAPLMHRGLAGMVPQHPAPRVPPAGKSVRHRGGGAVGAGSYGGHVRVFRQALHGKLPEGTDCPQRRGLPQ